MDFQTFDTAALDVIDAYKLLTGLVVPRPIGWVGTIDEHGRANLAPFSFFNAVAASPPTVLFAPSGQPAARKDTLTNVETTGEFTLSVVTAELLEAMNQTAVDAPAGTSEFELAGLTPVVGDHVAAPFVGEAKATMECAMTQVVDAGEGVMASRVVFGEVLGFRVATHLLDGTRIDQEELQAVGRHVGNLYSHTDNLVDLERPAWTD